LSRDRGADTERIAVREDLSASTGAGVAVTRDQHASDARIAVKEDRRVNPDRIVASAGLVVPVLRALLCRGQGAVTERIVVREDPPANTEALVAATRDQQCSDAPIVVKVDHRANPDRIVVSAGLVVPVSGAALSRNRDADTERIAARVDPPASTEALVAVRRGQHASDALIVVKEDRRANTRGRRAPGKGRHEATRIRVEAAEANAVRNVRFQVAESRLAVVGLVVRSDKYKHRLTPVSAEKHDANREHLVIQTCCQTLLMALSQ
jgi:hypothetical protein